MTTQQPDALIPDEKTVMAQAQVYASTWAIVGSRFDAGDGLELAEQEKTILADMVRRLGARITELESQLAQRFDAADVATASAQGFRDGVASVSAGSEPAAIRPDIQAVLAMLDVPVIARMSSHEGKLLKPGQEPPAFESAVPLVREWDHRRACESIIAALSRNN